MTVNSYTTWTPDPVQIEREAIQSAEKEKARIFALIAKESLPNGYTCYRGKICAFFESPNGNTLHRKPLEGLTGWADWWELINSIALNQNQ